MYKNMFVGLREISSLISDYFQTPITHYFFSLSVSLSFLFYSYGSKASKYGVQSLKYCQVQPLELRKLET